MSRPRGACGEHTANATTSTGIVHDALTSMWAGSGPSVGKTRSGVPGTGPLQGPLHGFRGEVKTDLRPVGFGFAAGVIMDLDDDIGLLRQCLAEAVGEPKWAQCPGTQPPISPMLSTPGPAIARIARRGVERVFLLSLAADVST